MTTDIIDVINRLFIATDNRDWLTVEECFADHVSLDMGEGASMKSAKDIVAGWTTGLAGVEAIHHQSGNFLVDVRDTEANAFCYGTAWHYRKTTSGRNTRVFVGSYDFHLTQTDRWRIDAMTFHLKFIDGNPELESD